MKNLRNVEASPISTTGIRYCFIAPIVGLDVSFSIYHYPSRGYANMYVRKSGSDDVIYGVKLEIPKSYRVTRIFEVCISHFALNFDPRIPF